jgi:hypothetical protein
MHILLDFTPIVFRVEAPSQVIDCFYLPEGHGQDVGIK